jgi:phosphoglycolate phosphatase
MAYPTLVLDLDGTLADTAPDLAATLNVILADEGLSPIPLGEIRAMIGAGARALLERGLAANGDQPTRARVDALFPRFLSHYEAHIADATQLFPGAEAALARFLRDGWRLAVCTNKLESLSIELMRALGIAQHFAAICGGDTFRFRKPDPRHLTATIARAGGDPAGAVMVGDSDTDISTARAAGVPVVAVDFGYTDVPVTELAPDAVIRHFDDLFDAVAGILRRGAATPATALRA